MIFDYSNQSFHSIMTMMMLIIFVREEWDEGRGPKIVISSFVDRIRQL